MTRSALSRRMAAAAAFAFTLALTGCSGEDRETGPTTPPTTPATTTTPTESPTTPEATDTTTAAPTATETATAAPTGTEPGSTATAAGGDAAALAELLPEGFPLPPELTITGDPTSTPDNANVAFTVPSGADAFDFFLAEIPAAGYELLPGTSNEYSPMVASGAILARGNGFDVNLLVVEDDVEITLTRTA